MTTEELVLQPIELPVQSPEPDQSFLIEVERFVWAREAREAFSVNGEGMTVAVLDTGLNSEHVDFAGRISTQYNATDDNGGDSDDATDGQGHGTNVGGIIVAGGDHTGIAPKANIIPVKVLTNTGSGSWASIIEGLKWVKDNREEFGISAVCMSLGESRNYTSDENLFGTNRKRIQKLIQELSKAKVAVCIAAGNDYASLQEEGMSFPAIVREGISVGAVYDADEGRFSYRSGAIAHSSKPGQITPFSQRLHYSTSRATRTDIFAPGAPVTSSGIMSKHGESTQSGTSQATPVVAGVVLLMQQFYKQSTGELPSMARLSSWLNSGGVSIYDGDDEHDNVTNTEKYYKRVDALSGLDAVRRYLQRARLHTLRSSEVETDAEAEA